MKYKSLVSAIILVTLHGALTGCGGSDDTNDEHDSTHDHGSVAASSGRLLIVDASNTETNIYDLSDSDLLASISLDSLPSAIYASAGYRYAALIERNADKVSFVNGGLWQEPHDDHFHTYSTTPTLLNLSYTGSRPTHFVPHGDQVAIFFDGDTTTGANAGVQVFNDYMVQEGEMPLTLEFSMPMHGVAEPRGDYMLATIRRNDSDSTSSNFILPDQVGVFHLHDDEYELEQTFDIPCPDLHGAAQNENHIIFGCSDGVLLVTDSGNNTFSAQKLLNSDDVAEGLRIGSVWGHGESGQFIAQASAHSSDTIQFFFIDPIEAEMELIDWQPVTNAKPVARAFTFEADKFVILDDQGYLTVIEPHLEDGRTRWDYSERMDITDADISEMPEGMKFSMALAQNDHAVYIADPIEQHVLMIDLELLLVEGEIALDYAPSMITWLGIAETHND